MQDTSHLLIFKAPITDIKDLGWQQEIQIVLHVMNIYIQKLQNRTTYIVWQWKLEINGN